MTALPRIDPSSLDPVLSVVDAFRSVTEEVDVELTPLEGSVPEGLRGVLYRNGAGKVEVEGVRQMHPFDGDGMVSRFEIGPRGVRYRNRYVRTRELREERAAGRMLYRSFGTNIPGGLPKNFLRTRFKNAANTSVVWHGGRLLALWEAGVPHALDSQSLATLGRFDFGGALQNRSATRLLAPELPFAAHPKICPRTGALYDFGLAMGPSTVLFLYRSPPSGEGLEVRRFPLPRSSFMHDFALTERFAVFFASPVRFDVARTLTGLLSPVEAICRDPGAPTAILVVPRDGGALRAFEAPSGFFLFHFFGAWDDGDQVFVTGSRMPDFKGGTVDLASPEAIRSAPFEPGFPTRWTIDLASGRVEERIFDVAAMELPTIDPRRVSLPHRFGWATARRRGGPPVFTGLGRVDFEREDAVVRDFGADLPGEPLFVPRSADAPEGDGWLLSLVYRAETRKSELWVLDAGSLERQARFGLPHHQPPGFHGCFVPSA